MCNYRPCLKMSALAIGVWMVCARPLPAAITNIVDSSTDPAASLPSAALSPSLFNSGVPSIRDRVHCPKPAAFNSDGRLSLSTTPDLPGLFPSYLVGQQYVYFKQGTRTWTNYAATISVDQDSRAYLLVDNRVSDGGINSYSTFEDPIFGTNVLVYTNAVGNQCVDPATPADFPLTQWVIDDGWTRVNTGLSPHYNNPGYCVYDLVQGDYLGVDENCNGDLNQFYAIYTKQVPAGASVTVRQQAGGFNMYGLVVSTNTAPPRQWAIWSSKARDTLWDTANNWYANSVPAADAAILFPETASDKTVSLNNFGPTNGPLQFAASGDYNVGGSGDTLTLSGDITQNGSGQVTFDSAIDLGGNDRVFGGTGSGTVTLNNPITGNEKNAIFGAGNYVISNPANTVNQFQVTNGAKLTILGTLEMAAYPSASYFGGNGTSGGGYALVNGGTLNYAQSYEDIPGTSFIGYWNGHGIDFGPNGGTLLLNQDYPVDQGPTFYKSSVASGSTGTIVVGWPLPFTGDGRGSNYTGPWDAPSYGLAIGPAGNAGYGASYACRQGEGDLMLTITNGAMAYLEWSIMTNGNLIIQGQPGGNSAVGEVDANGSTTNVGRFCIRGPHRGTQQPGYARAFYLNQPYAMKFYAAVQVWERDSVQNLACDMSFEPGSSVDFCGGKNNRPLRLGAPTTGSIPTNTLTIKGGGNCNLNLQLRTQHWEGNGPADGQASGVQVCAETYIQDNGQLKIYRSQSGASTARAIEVCRPITGQGSSSGDARVVVDLPYALGGGGDANTAGGAPNDGVNFDGFSTAFGPGCSLIVNGSGLYGLRVQGYDQFVTNLLSSARLSGLTGSGGTLTVAITNNGTLTIPNGPSSRSAVSLGLDSQGGSTPTYVLGTDASLANFAGLVLKSGTVSVSEPSSVTMQTLRLAGSATINLGTGSGGAVLHFANSSAVAWNVGTLTITSWNGSTSGGGSDRIYFGTDATGLNAAKLAQIKWVTPNGGADVLGAMILSTGEIVPAAPAGPTTIGSAAIVSGQLVFHVTPGSPAQTSVVQCATNLTPPVIWTNIRTNTGAFGFTNATALPESYYRVLVR